MAALTNDSWILWLLCLPVIGGLQNHLMLLHHEGGHRLLHPRRQVNDFLTNVFCGYPFFELLQPYRDFHFAHHRYLTDPARDPEVPFYLEQGHAFTRPIGMQRLRMALLDLSGYHWLQFFVSFARSLKPGARLFTKYDQWSVAAFTLLLFALIGMGALKTIFFYWLVPQLTFAFYFAKERGYREHGARRAPAEACTFDLEVRPLERFFIFPLHTHRHLTHHLQPGLCWFELGEGARRR